MNTFFWLAACVHQDSFEIPPDHTSTYPEIPAELEESGAITCEQPEKRAENPLLLTNLGSTWQSQPASGYTPTEGNWFGGEGVVVADWTGNGKADIFVPTLEQNLLFIQAQDGSFTEEFQLRFPSETAQISVGGSAADYDGDGDLDLLVLNFALPTRLYENIGDGYFVLHENMEFLQHDHYSPGSTWADIDGDTDLDLLILTLGEGPSGPPPWEDENNFTEAGPNQLYQNQNGLSFSQIPLPNHTPEPNSCCASILDIDLNGYPDLYIVNDFGQYVQPNQVFFSTETSPFEPSLESDLTIPMFGMGLAVGELNGDLYPDFLATDWGRNWLLLSDGVGGWYDATQSQGLIAQQEDQHVAWGTELIDVDNDGDLDAWIGFGQLNIPTQQQDSFDNVGLYNPRYQPDALYLQDQNGSFEDVAESWGIDRNTITRGSVWTDLNDDGFLDFLSTAIDGPVQAYLAHCDESAWLRVQLRQKNLNTHAIGAYVEIWTGETRQVRWLLSGTQLSSSTPPEVHFGLGDHDTIDLLRVIWPDRSVSVFQNIQTRQILTIRRSE
ncbi:MAG: CRTAC1 family protein [Myxococcota bacterium]|nr:CRTAC1 family protein [Myxococcota bacterium]